MSLEKVERNKLIVEDKKTMSWTELIIEHRMSYSSLRRIVKRYDNTKKG